ncbi:MAG TPA: hypothetical protein VK563_22400, partial [Puia sp.]|nr:hypothetical protein [Puia sp.]
IAQTFLPDTLGHRIFVKPVKDGDSWPVLQSAADFCKQHVGYKIILGQGDFHISRPWELFWQQGKDYITVTYDIQGACYAMNAQPGYTSNIIPEYTDAPAIIMQDNKGTRIQDITIQGKYNFPLGLNQIQVDTLHFNEWNDHKCADNRTAPYAGIVIDPFSDPDYFGTVWPEYARMARCYVKGMSRNGSTAITITGCAITNFVVGLQETGGWQYNGELINVAHNRIQSCKVEIAWSQAQSKANIVSDLMVWGNTHTVFDGVNYGFTHNDASTSPFIEKVNIAGNCHQIFNVYASTFPLSAKQIYAEGLFKFGIVRGLVGAHFDDVQIDYQNADPGSPSPDFYYAGYATTWTGGMQRLYNTRPSRIVLDFPTNTFLGMTFNAPPVCWNGSGNLPQFNNCSMFYWYGTMTGVLSSNAYDNRAYLGGQDTLHVNRSTFNGWFISGMPVTGLEVGDLLVCTKQFEDDYHTITGSNYPLGFVTAIAGRKISLSNIGWGFHEGDIITPVHYKIKPL